MPLSIDDSQGVAFKKSRYQNLRKASLVSLAKGAKQASSKASQRRRSVHDALVGDAEKKARHGEGQIAQLGFDRNELFLQEPRPAEDFSHPRAAIHSIKGEVRIGSLSREAAQSVGDQSVEPVGLATATATNRVAALTVECAGLLPSTARLSICKPTPPGSGVLARLALTIPRRA